MQTVIHTIFFGKDTNMFTRRQSKKSPTTTLDFTFFNVRNDIKLPDTQVLKMQDPDLSNPFSSSIIPMRHTLMPQVSPFDLQQAIPSIPSTFAMDNFRYHEPRKWDAKRPYKPVHKKHRPVPATFPEDA